MLAPAVKTWLYPALIAAGMSAFAGYLHNDKDLISRVVALETGRTEDGKRLDRIENKLDKLVEWALGAK